MSRPVAVTGGAFLALGLAIFCWKWILLGLPLIPSDPEGLWRVELEIDVRGQGTRASVRAALPSSGPGQRVEDEHLLADRLFFTTRLEDGQRFAVWTGTLEGVHHLSHGFRARIWDVDAPLPRGVVSAPPPAVVGAYGHPSAGIPVDAPEILEQLFALNLGEANDPVGQLRTLFSFVSNEIALVGEESDDALLTLESRQGSAEGKARLLVTLLRAAGIPARVVQGLRLEEDREPREEVWSEAWIDGEWIPLSAAGDGFFARKPSDLLVLRHGIAPTVQAGGVTALSSRYRSLRQRLRPEELATLMQPPNRLLQALSLYRLPVGIQHPLRLLLVFPLGALMMALFRNVVGLPTFGTFLPILVALALRASELLPGLLMVASIILLGIAGRLAMDRLHLLLVPRLCVILCLVVLCLAGFALLGLGFGSHSLFGGVLLPIVIMSMLIERFSVTSAEEGMREATVKLGWTMVLAVCVYPLFRSELAQHLMLGFPELILCVIGVLVMLGGYTGYRLLELLRFRALVATPGGEGT